VTGQAGPPLTAVSLFAGIGGVDLAMHQAGIEVVAAVEIDPGARAIYNTHFPRTHLFTDVREVGGHELLAAGFVAERGVIAAGWPCQGNSVAGRRGGLADPRSGLWRHVVRLLAATRAAWFLGENVPGLLSVNAGQDFRTVLADLAELGMGFAWRVLDAQHFGVPQRRRRLILVGHLGSASGPVQVLLEPEGGGGHPAAGGPTRPDSARATALGAARRRQPDPGGSSGQDEGTRTGEGAAAGAGVVIGAVTGTGPGGGWRAGPDEAAAGQLVAHVSTALTRRYGKGADSHASATLIPLAFDLAQLTSPDNRVRPEPGDPAMPLAATGQPHLAYALRAAPGGVGQGHNTTYVSHPITHALTAEGADASEDGTGRGTPLVPYGIGLHGQTSTGGAVSATVPGSHGQPPGVVEQPGEPLAAAVRRLTPVECERLQGLPDGWTAGASDAARYRYLGNTVAVPVLAWIARRLCAVHSGRGTPRGV
jgi:DNA (cytosine-5)-methyltransferase 1